MCGMAFKKKDELNKELFNSVQQPAINIQMNLKKSILINDSCCFWKDYYPALIQKKDSWNGQREMQTRVWFFHQIWFVNKEQKEEDDAVNALVLQQTCSTLCLGSGPELLYCASKWENSYFDLEEDA